jgi:hypothetical protein
MNNFRDFCVYSKLNLKSVFCDRHKTAFTSGNCEFVRLPYGLKNATGNFQESIDLMLDSVLTICDHVFIDVPCYSESQVQYSKLSVFAIIGTSFVRNSKFVPTT